MAKNLTASTPVKQYWNRVKDFIDATGNYSWAVKLQENLRDPSTKNSVIDVLNHYYDGSMIKLEEDIRKRYSVCKAKLAKVNTELKANGITQAADETLISLLIQPHRRKYYRRFAERWMNKNRIATLQFIEDNYRELLDKPSRPKPKPKAKTKAKSKK